MTVRCHILPPRGTLLVSTDVHGNGDDFRRMRDVFLKEAAEAAESVYWVILGDVVHAPSHEARRRNPEQYDYDDESWQIVDMIRGLQAKHPEQVLFVLGNHDWAHIGGPRTAKFHEDEAAHVEQSLDASQIAAMHELFREALLCVLAPCGAFMSHGSPGALPESLEEIDELNLGSPDLTERQQAFLRNLMMSYGQREAVCRSFLETISDLSELKLSFVVHGHDRDEEGWFVHEETQICPVIFGAPKPNKRYLRLDLASRYESVHDLRDGNEILRLWNG